MEVQVVELSPAQFLELKELFVNLLSSVSYSVLFVGFAVLGFMAVWYFWSKD